MRGVVVRGDETGARSTRLLVRLGGVVGLLLAVAAGYASAAGIGVGSVFTPSGLDGFLGDGIVAGSDGKLWVGEVTTEGTPPVVLKLSTTGEITEDTGFSATAVPGALAVGPDGSTWFTDLAMPSAIGKITESGTITEYPVDAGDQARSLALGSNGNFWFTGSRKIGEITPDGHVTTFAGGFTPNTTVGGGPLSIAKGSDGNMWFPVTGGIGRITPDGTITVFTAGMQPGADLQGVALGPDGDIWFTDAGDFESGPNTPAVGRITPEGIVTEFTSGLTADNDPTQIAAGADGNMWFVDGFAQAVWRITPAGTITRFATDAAGIRPFTLTTGPDSNLWLTSSVPTAIAQFGVGAPPATVSAPAVSGAHRVGDTETCSGAIWSTWAGQQPSLTATSYDGYQWLLDGDPIAGATNDSYTPVAGDGGHVLTCKVTVTYTLFPVTVSASSTPATVQAGGSGSGGGGGGGGAPNIHVAVSSSPTPHAVGDQFDYSFLVTNQGGASNGTTLTINLPPQVSYQGYHVDRGPGCNASGQTISCNLDFFSPGMSSTVQIGAQITSPGTALLTTSTFSSPQEYNPADSAVTYSLSLGSTSTGPTQPPPAPPPPAPGGHGTAAAVTVSGLGPILLQVKRPTVRFVIHVSKQTTLAIRLVGKNGKVLATWHAKAAKGSSRLKLLLPKDARHRGRDKLEVLAAGAKSPKSWAVTLGP